MQVRGGDFPLGSDRIASLVLLGGVERSDRLEAFMQRARDAAKEADDVEPRENPGDVWRNDQLEDLI